jgi:hypothetical protein
MKKTLNIFVYKGYLGATTDIENGKFLNDVEGKSQLGCVVDIAESQISQEALDFIKTNVVKGGGSFAELMLTEVTDGSMNIGVMGFGRHLLATPDSPPEIGRLCELKVLYHVSIVEDNVPEDFKHYVDDILAK